MEAGYNPAADPMNGPNRLLLERPHTPFPEANIESGEELAEAEAVPDSE
jgi:hypothetical protein